MQSRKNPIIEAESIQEFKFLMKAYKNLSNYIYIPNLKYRIIKRDILFEELIHLQVEYHILGNIGKIKFNEKMLSNLEYIVSDIEEKTIRISIKEPKIKYLIEFKKEDKE